MFPNKRERMATATAHRASKSGGATFSVIGADIVVKGDIIAQADLHIDGAVEGDVRCAALVQGESGRIHGTVEARSARLAGQVTGTIRARELIIMKSARIEGDVHYEALTIEQGATVDGRFAPDADGDTGESAQDGAEPHLTLAR